MDYGPWKKKTDKSIGGGLKKTWKKAKPKHKVEDKKGKLTRPKWEIEGQEWETKKWEQKAKDKKRERRKLAWLE